MKKLMKKSVTFSLILVLCFTLMTAFATTEAQAASKNIHLKSKSDIVQVDGTYQLKLLSTNGKAISASKVAWTSANKSIATVSKKGVVTGKKVGNVKITAKYKGKKYIFTAKIKAPYFMSGAICEFMRLGDEPCNVQFYGYKNGKAINLSNNAQVEWVLSDANVIRIENGYAYATEAGYTDISVIYKGKQYNRSKGIIVVSPYFKDSNVTAKTGENVKQELYCTRENGEEYPLSRTLAFAFSGSWASNNYNVATVDSDGNVTARSAGTATITATIGKFSYSYILTVENPKLSVDTPTYPSSSPGKDDEKYEPTIKRCIVADCNEIRGSAGLYCFDHSCITSGCNNFKEAWEFYCTVHKCGFSGCTYEKDENSNYCKVHHCNEPHCGNLKENNFWCSVHKRCAISSCNQMRDGATRYCRQHAAMNFK